MRRKPIALVILILLAAASADAGSVTEPAAVTATVDAFLDALERDDEKAAMELLAPDAVVLESGSAETRAEYEQHHLKKDIAFAREVKSIRSVLSVRLEGDAAWVVSTSRTTGSFGGREINSVGTELVVLTKSAKGWRIRAIHWSSHDTKKNN